jgi:hypothetical protein
MRRSLPNVPAIVAGFAIILLGAFAAYEATNYEIGTVAMMGAGFFPLALGVSLIGLGAVLVGSFVLSDDMRFDFPIGPFLLIASGILAFAMLLERFGLVSATVALVILSSLADRRNNAVMIAISAIALSLFGVAVFIWGLRLPLAPFVW